MIPEPFFEHAMSDRWISTGLCCHLAYAENRSEFVGGLLFAPRAAETPFFVSYASVGYRVALNSSFTFGPKVIGELICASNR